MGHPSDCSGTGQSGYNAGDYTIEGHTVSYEAENDVLYAKLETLHRAARLYGKTRSQEEN